MTDFRWQPLPGTTVLSMRQWNKIPDEFKPALEKAARQAGSRLQKRVRELEEAALTAMKEHGLTVHPVPKEAEEQWRTLVREKGYPVFVGPRFSEEMFHRVRGLLDEYRQGRPLQTATGR
jgi:TRAP-type C4-dicarboxylate transport system substrate-binding protein